MGKSQLTDKSPMPYGMYRDILMEEIPPKYFLFLLSNSHHCSDSVKEYIENNIDILKSKIKN